VEQLEDTSPDVLRRQLTSILPKSNWDQGLPSSHSPDRAFGRFCQSDAEIYFSFATPRDNING
jgi:hypothetical protein